jgi:hypothetical protein
MASSQEQMQNKANEAASNLKLEHASNYTGEAVVMMVGCSGELKGWGSTSVERG